MSKAMADEFRRYTVQECQMVEDPTEDLPDHMEMDHRMKLRVRTNSYRRARAKAAALALQHPKQAFLVINRDTVNTSEQARALRVLTLSGLQVVWDRV